LTIGVWRLRARRATNAKSEDPSLGAHASGAFLRAPVAKTSSQK